MVISDVTGLTKGSECRIEVKCDICGEHSFTTFANYFNSQEKRGWSGTTYCRSCVCKISGLKRKGKPAYNKGKKLDESQKGINHPSWKGGKYIASDGYVMVYVGGEKREIGWRSYKKEHIVIVESILNRHLESYEVVHHIDGQKTNNECDNLWVTTSQGHKNAHNSLQNLGYFLYQQGIIGFNKETGQYFLKDKNENS